MSDTLPYCGAPPIPGLLAGRFNLDPVLLSALALVAAFHLIRLHDPVRRRAAAAGWSVAAAALVSPLCALSVSLFAARVAQHMILILVAAPLIARALPPARSRSPHALLAGASAAFTVLLWGWHMPGPYDATFRSTPIYWTMHVSLFGSAVLLWRELLHARDEQLLGATLAGLVAAIQMGLLGAILSLAPAPLFRAHLLTSDAWGLAPLADQQLGGLLMWVPGGLGFLWIGLAGIARLMRPAGQGTMSAGNA